MTTKEFDFLIISFFTFEQYIVDEFIRASKLMSADLIDRWQRFIFQLPSDTSHFHVHRSSFTWQMRRIDLIIKRENSEQAMTLSRFQPDFILQL